MVVIAHEAVGVADPVEPPVYVLQDVQKIEAVLVSALKTAVFSLPREVIWWTAPVYSIRRGRAMGNYAIKRCLMTSK